MDFYKNVHKLYFIIFFHNLIPAYVIERLFWEQRGMTVLMVVLCEIIYAVTIVIFEIPTGVLADKYGRKALLVFGALLSLLEFIILIFAYNFLTFAVVVFLAGIAGACTSGALNALLYDSLLAAKKEVSFVNIIGKINSLDFIAGLLAALCGSVLAELYGFELNYILSAVSTLLALGFTIFLKDPRRNGGQEDTNDLKDYFIHSVSFYKSKPKVISVITHAMAIGACVTYFDEFWQLYLDEIGIPFLFFGLFSAFISLARIPGNLLAAYLIKYFKEETIILFVLGISTIGFFMTTIFHSVIGLIMIIVFLASGVVDPVIAGYLHHHVNSHIRATIESVQSLIERAITFIIGIGFGLIATNGSVISGFTFLGLVSSLFFLLFWRSTKKHEIL